MRQKFRNAGRRFALCLGVGALVALAAGWYSIHRRHARLLAAAARAHQTTGVYLAFALTGMAVAVAVIVFVVASIVAASRSRRTQPANPRRGGGAYYPGSGWSEWQ